MDSGHNDNCGQSDLLWLTMKLMSRSTLADNDNDNDIDGRSTLADNDRGTRGLMEESWNYQLRQHSSAN